MGKTKRRVNKFLSSGLHLHAPSGIDPIDAGAALE
jgi:hypothetical protein